MDYAKVLRRAWEITWRWKVLWILGFLASLGSGGGGGGPTYSTNGGEDFDPSRWGGELFGPEVWAGIAGIVLALLCLFLLIAIALWVISIIARGGLIAGVQQVEDEGSTSFGQAWRVGRSRFWTLFGIAVLAAIPFLILAVGLAIVFALGILFAVGASEFSEAAGAGGILTAICLGGAFCCGMVLLAIVLDQIRTYAERAAILEGLGWIDAFKRGWQVLTENLGPTIIFWLIFFAIGLVLVALIMGALVAVAAPLFVIFGNVEPGPWIVAPLCCGGLLAVIVFALIGAVVETFTSATWTLVYRELTGFTPQPAAELLFEE
jgi:hypothetical protein